MTTQPFSVPTPPSWPKQAALVLLRELLLERKSGEIVVTSGFFALLVVVMSSVAFTLGDSKAQIAPGVIWVSICFASVLAVSRAWQREREENALQGVLLSPLKPSAFFAGKTLGITIFLLAIETLVLPITSLLFGVDVVSEGPFLVLIALFATPGIAATGTIFGAMIARTKARDLLLASVVFPLLTPTLLAAIAASRAALSGASGSELIDFLLLMLAFDSLFVAGGLGLFGSLIEG